MFSVLVSVVILAYFLYTYVINKEFRNKILKFKTAPGLPLLGNIFQLGFSNDELLSALERLWLKFDRDRFLIKVGPLNQLILTKPKDVEAILSNPRLLVKNDFYKILGNHIGSGLLMAHGDQWRMHRKILTPAFHFKVLETYLPVFEDEIKNFMEIIRVNFNTDIDIFPLLHRFSIVTLIRIGFNINASDYFEDYIKESNFIANVTNSKIFTVWKNIDFIYDMTSEGKAYNKALAAVNQTNKLVLEMKREELKDLLVSVQSSKQTIESIVEGSEAIEMKGLTFIELLILSRKQNGEPLSDKEIMHELNTYIFAGHETITSAQSFLLYILSQHSKIQQKVFEEQVEITNGDLKQLITYKDIQKMKYLDNVIKESLRINSTAVLFGRKITENVILHDGVQIPVGVNVLLMPYLSSKDPTVFSCPDKFDPDRFLETKLNQFSFYPFSAGPRNCIGQKLAMLILKHWTSTIVRSLKILPAKAHKPNHIMELVLKSSNGIHVQFAPRQ